MNLLIEKAKEVKKKNGNGVIAMPSDEVCGRGLKHRVFRNYYERLEEAADVASRVRRYTPTLEGTATSYGVSLNDLRKHLKARAAVQKHIDKLEPELESVSPVERLMRAWNAATANDHEWFVREVGVDALWDVIDQIIR